VLVGLAVLAFFAALLLERGAAASPASQTSGSVTPSQSDGGTFFSPGSIAPAQDAPSTSTGVS
jgi:hypothetical protein